MVNEHLILNKINNLLCRLCSGNLCSKIQIWYDSKQIKMNNLHKYSQHIAFADSFR